MKIKIESDVFDIIERIKDIDEGYYILYDTIKNKFEIHNSNQIQSYCLTSKFNSIDSRMIDEIKMSLVSNIDIIMEVIDRNNKNKEKESMNKLKDDSDYLLREIFKYSSNSSKDYTETSAFSTIWR